jgi:arylsulfatase A-like enzyme
LIRLTSAACASAAALLCLAATTSAQERPNILFIMSDDHAEQAISAYGSELIRTPNIDRIAREGVLFRNAFVTNSICAPSRAVLLTGKYSHLNGLRDNRDEFDGSQQTFPKLLQVELGDSAGVAPPGG